MRSNSMYFDNLEDIFFFRLCFLDIYLNNIKKSAVKSLAYVYVTTNKVSITYYSTFQKANIQFEMERTNDALIAL